MSSLLADGFIIFNSLAIAGYNAWKAFTPQWFPIFHQDCKRLDQGQLDKVKEIATPILKGMNLSFEDLSFYLIDDVGPAFAWTSIRSKGEIQISPRFFELDQKIQSFILKREVGHLYYQHAPKLALVEVLGSSPIALGLRFFQGCHFATTFAVTACAYTFYTTLVRRSLEERADLFAFPKCSNEELEAGLTYLEAELRDQAKRPWNSNRKSALQQELQFRSITFTPSADDVDRVYELLFQKQKCS